MSARARGFESHPLRWRYLLRRTRKCSQLNKIIYFGLVWRSTQEAEGTPLERVQVVNSGARVQIRYDHFDTSPSERLCQAQDIYYQRWILMSTIIFSFFDFFKNFFLFPTNTAFHDRNFFLSFPFYVLFDFYFNVFCSVICFIFVTIQSHAKLLSVNACIHTE